MKISSRLRVAALLLVAAAVTASSRVEPEPSAPRRDWDAGASLQLGSGQSLSLRWKARAWDAEEVRRLRQDAGARRLANPLLPVQLGIEFETPVALRSNDLEIDPGSHRLALQMDDAGVLRLQLLKEQRFHDLGAAPFEDRRSRSHLALSMSPSPRGTMALRWEWGPEWGEAVFFVVDR